MGLHNQNKIRVLYMWEQMTSPASRWLYGILLSIVILPLSKWVSNSRKEKREFVEKVGKLEGKIKGIGAKLDSEIIERRMMETKFDKLDEKIDTKFEKFGETLNQIALNTAVNTAKIDK